MIEASRRDFLKRAAAMGAAAWGAGQLLPDMARAAGQQACDIRLGLVTYQWGRDWDLPTLIANLAKTKVLGVELRTSHAHKVEPNLDAGQRIEVKRRFADSPVTLVGLGSTEEFHSPDPLKLQKAIEATKAFIKLSHDVGGSGVKVRPNALPKGVPVEKTIEQIGKSLNVVGAFGADYGQQIRLEIHGGCARIPIIKQIIDVASHPNVALCWNTNAQDLEKPGLEHNFNLLKARLGATTHCKTVDFKDYPMQELLNLFVAAKYHGWWLIEAGNDPPDRVKALAQQRVLFDAMLETAVSGRRSAIR
jgi:sugar phosphate isomerase/epimerase